MLIDAVLQIYRCPKCVLMMHLICASPYKYINRQVAMTCYSNINIYRHKVRVPVAVCDVDVNIPKGGCLWPCTALCLPLC